MYSLACVLIFMAIVFLGYFVACLIMFFDGRW